MNFSMASDLDYYSSTLDGIAVQCVDHGDNATGSALRGIAKKLREISMAEVNKYLEAQNEKSNSSDSNR